MPYTEIELPAGDPTGLDAQLAPYSLMTRSEREFLRLMVERRQPAKALELGVAKGASSAIILLALEPEGHLCSVDYLDNYFGDTSKRSGWACPILAPDRQSQWRLFTGGLCARFMGEIGDGIAFAFLDTIHVLPGEILDFLLTYPYLAKDAVVAIHDISNYELALLEKRNQDAVFQLPCRLLFSLLPGEKLVPASTEHKFFPNIGAVRLDGTADRVIDDLFGLLTLPWKYMPKAEDLDLAEGFIAQHYGSGYGRQFAKAAAMQREAVAILESLSPFMTFAKGVASFIDNRLFHRERLY